jgi:hypothetical protein
MNACRVDASSGRSVPRSGRARRHLLHAALCMLLDDALSVAVHS